MIKSIQNDNSNFQQVSIQNNSNLSESGYVIKLTNEHTNENFMNDKYSWNIKFKQII